LSSNIVDFVRVAGDRNRKDINAILAKLQDLTAAEPEDAALQERIILSDGTRLKSTTVTSGTPDETIANNRDKDGVNIFQRETKPIVNSYPLIHTSNSFSGITFPANNTKFGGRIEFDGTGWMTIANNSLLNITDKLSIAFWANLIAFTGSARRIMKKGDGGGVPYHILINTSANTINFTLMVNGVVESITSGVYTPGVWTHYVLAWDNVSNEMELHHHLLFS